MNNISLRPFDKSFVKGVKKNIVFDSLEIIERIGNRKNMNNISLRPFDKSFVKGVQKNIVSDSLEIIERM